MNILHLTLLCCIVWLHGCIWIYVPIYYIFVVLGDKMDVFESISVYVYFFDLYIRMWEVHLQACWDVEIPMYSDVFLCHLLSLFPYMNCVYTCVISAPKSRVCTANRFFFKETFLFILFPRVDVTPMSPVTCWQPELTLSLADTPPPGDNGLLGAHAKQTPMHPTG